VPAPKDSANQTRILISFACVYLFWGSTYLAMRYGLEVLPGVGHFVMDQAAARATELMLAHIARHPV